MTGATLKPTISGGIVAPPPLRLADVSLFADLDGTLTPLEATPGAVGPDPRRRALLDGLSLALSGRLAIVSGRALSDIDRILEGRIAAVAAVHGLVRRTANGRVLEAAGADRLREAVSDLRAFTARNPALLLEDKGAAVALHYRGAPAAGPAARDLVRDLAERLDLVTQNGDMVAELRAAGPDKGGAVAAFMTEPPFAGSTPVFIGDDFTDEHGFRAAIALGGHGVVVGPRRPTLAAYALESVAAAQTWLWQAVKRAA